MGTESPPNPSESDANNALTTGVYYANGGSAVNYFSGYTALLTLSRLPTNKTQIQVNASGGIGARAYSGTWSAWVTHYNTLNTTKASDGTLKAASPVARIVTSQEACQRADIAEDGFSWCGCGTANAEAEGITLSRLEAGVYVLAGSAGLASEGWQLLPPMDPGGMGELGIVEAEQTESGGLTIRLFKRKYMLSEDGEIVKTKGEPMDVPANSWIDVRLDMPANSLFNQRMNQEPQK
ncbi:pyocin knob domain-containing protein [Enterobacter cloacae]|uniref:pyocin knob domain-containing protein n=1 Tax=Enterobacter cloacae TaxID=550 RepID=UPI003314F3C8